MHSLTLKFSLRYTNLANVGKKERGERKRVGTGNMEVKGGGRKGDMQGTEEELAGYHQKVAGLQAVVRMRLLQ